MADANTCVMCGQIILEDEQVCTGCQKRTANLEGFQKFPERVYIDNFHRTKGERNEHINKKSF